MEERSLEGPFERLLIEVPQSDFEGFLKVVGEKAEGNSTITIGLRTLRVARERADVSCDEAKCYRSSEEGEAEALRKFKEILQK
jgi:hypothetical protein